jgi:membrane fusion protein, multidrug efflux system
MKFCSRLLCAGLLICASASALADDDLAPVEVAPLETSDDGLRLQLSGVVSTPRISQLSARVDGLLAEVAVDAGDEVEAGDVVATLDDTLARLAERRLDATVEEARVAFAETERLLGEAERLVARGNIPASEVETRRAEVGQSRAALARLQAEAAEVREVRRRHALIAPFDGTVSLRLAEAGEWVATGTPVVELIDLKGLRLDIQVPQQAYRQLALKDPVQIQLDAESELVDGRIAARVPRASAEGRTFLLRVAFDTPPEGVVPGMSATVGLPLQRGEQTARVPRDALIRRADGTTRVWVANMDVDPPVARAVDVVAGRPRGDWIEVRGELADDAMLVVRGNERLSEGQALAIRKP